MSVRVSVCVCVWEEDRLPTCKWLAIIRRSVTRGYVRQLKLCFLTETWFMLLVVTVTTSKRDRKQTQTKAGEINAGAVQPLCWCPLPLRQSRRGGSAHAGSFLSPGAARLNSVGRSCEHEKTGPRISGVWPAPGLPVCPTHLGEQYRSVHWGSECSVASAQKGRNPSVWLSCWANFAQVVLCSIARRERTGVGFELVPVP